MLKRGLSPVIGSIILILLVVTAAGIAWVVIGNMIEEDLGDAAGGVGKVNLQIEEIEYDSTNVGKEFSIRIKRKKGEGKLAKIKLIFSNDDKTVVEEIANPSLDEFGMDTYSFSLAGIYLDKIEVIPIIEKESGKEAPVGVTDSYEPDAEEKLILFEGGPVAWWKFDGNAKDSAGDYGGKIYGGVEFVEGVNGKAANFNGTNLDMIQVGNVLNMGEKDMTFSVWIKTTQGVGGGSILAKAWGQPYYFFKTQEGQALATLSQSDAANVQSWSEDAIINDGEWHFVSAVYDRDSELTIFVDGVKKQNNSISSFSSLDVGNEHLLMIGGNCNINCDGGNKGNYFDGQMDDLMIFNKALSEAQINELYALKL